MEKNQDLDLLELQELALKHTRERQHAFTLLRFYTVTFGVCE